MSVTVGNVVGFDQQTARGTVAGGPFAIAGKPAIFTLTPGRWLVSADNSCWFTKSGAARGVKGLQLSPFTEDKIVEVAPGGDATWFARARSGIDTVVTTTLIGEWE